MKDRNDLSQTATHDIYRDFYSLLLATLDGDHERAHFIIGDTDIDALVHLLAHKLIVSLIADEDILAAGADAEHPAPVYEDLRQELRADLVRLTQGGEA